jgi:hypothetical protein
MVALVSLGVGFAIHKASALQPEQNAMVNFTIHLPTLRCQLEGYKILGNHTSGYFDSGDVIQQQLWDLAQKCHGRIESTKTPIHTFVPQGPSRKG